MQLKIDKMHDSQKKLASKKEIQDLYQSVQRLGSKDDFQKLKMQVADHNRNCVGQVSDFRVKLQSYEEILKTFDEAIC